MFVPYASNDNIFIYIKLKCAIKIYQNNILQSSSFVNINISMHEIKISRQTISINRISIHKTRFFFSFDGQLFKCKIHHHHKSRSFHFISMRNCQIYTTYGFSHNQISISTAFDEFACKLLNLIIWHGSGLSGNHISKSHR